MKKGYIRIRANNSRAAPWLWVPVQVIGERKVADRTDWLIVPIGGEGTAWVRYDRLKENPQ